MTSIKRPPHHEKIHQLALEIVNSENDESECLAYKEIINICEAHKSTVLDHPFQWETLGDFTFNNPEKALLYYLYGLELAQKANLNEYVGSIRLAMAEQYQELKDFEKSWECLDSANKALTTSSDLTLKQEVSEALLSASRHIN